MLDTNHPWGCRHHLLYAISLGWLLSSQWNCLGKSTLSSTELDRSSIQLTHPIAIVGQEEPAEVILQLQRNNGELITGQPVTLWSSEAWLETPSLRTDERGLARSIISSQVAGRYNISAAIEVDAMAIEIPATATQVFVDPQMPESIVAGHAMTLQLAINSSEQGASQQPWQGTLTLRSSDPLAQFPQSITLTQQDQGYFLLDKALIFKTSGRQTLEAFEQSTDQVLFRKTIDVRANGPAAITAQVPALPLTVGQRYDVEVTIIDDFGNRVPDFSGTLRFDSSDPQAELPQPYTFQTEDAGQHRFTQALRWIRANQQSFSISDRQNTSIRAYMLSIFIQPGDLASISLTGSSQGRIGELLPFQLVLQDAFGNTLPHWSSHISLTCTDQTVSCPQPWGSTPVVPHQMPLQMFVGQSVRNILQLITTNAQGASIQATQTIDRLAGELRYFSVLDVASTYTAGQPWTVRVRPLDETFNTIPQFTGVIGLQSSDPATVISPSQWVVTPGHQGEVSFTVTPAQAGTMTLTAFDLGSPIASTIEYTVEAEPIVDHFQFSQVPAMQEAGQFFTLTLEAKDRFNNAIPQYLGEVLVTSTCPNSLLPQSIVFQASDQGRKQSVGPMTIYQAGDCRLQAAAIHMPHTTSMSERINIFPSPLSQLAFAPFSSQAFTCAPLPTITVVGQDQFGNTLPFTGTLSIRLQDSLHNALLQGGSQRSAQQGHAEFSDLHISKAGTYTLRATHPQLRAATSLPIQITNRAPTITINQITGINNRIHMDYSITSDCDVDVLMQWRIPQQSLKLMTPLQPTDGIYGIRSMGQPVQRQYTWDSARDMGSVHQDQVEWHLTVQGANGTSHIQQTLPIYNGRMLAYQNQQSMSEQPDCAYAYDLNQDGFMDNIICQSNPQEILIQWNDGGGQTDSTLHLPLALRATLLLMFDANEDGYEDMMVGQGASDMLVFLGDGVSFQAPQTIGLQWPPTAWHHLDMNQDGHQDIAYLAADGHLHSLYGNGLGGFMEQITIDLPAFGQQLVPVLLNPDNQTDLLITLASNQLLIGQAAFGSYIWTPHTFNQPIVAIDTKDINEDLRPDILVATTSQLYLLRQDGQGNFTPELYVQTPWPMSTAQFLQTLQASSHDIVVMATEQNQLIWYPSSSSGHGQPVSMTSPQAIRGGLLVVADRTGDGQDDVVVWTDTMQQFTQRMVGQAQSQHLQTGIQYPAFPSNPGVGPQADVDEDGILDALIFSGHNVQWAKGTGVPPALYHPAITIGTTQSPKEGLFADLNGDHHLDVVVSSAGAGSILVWLGDGTGQWTALPPVFVMSGANGLATGDLNQDGFLDILVLSSSLSRKAMLFNDGNGRLIAHPSSTTVPLPLAVALLDLNQDGRLDVLIDSEVTSQIIAHLNLGRGQLEPAYRWSQGITRDLPLMISAKMITVDFDQDGLLDVIGGRGLAFNQGNGWPSHTAYVGEGSFAVGDINGDLSLDIISTWWNTQDSRVYLNNGNRGWTQQIMRLEGQAVMGVDVNNDRLVDFFACLYACDRANLSFDL